MAQMSARARFYTRQAEENYASEEPQGTDADFDTALRLAHHAQRLKAIEIGSENLSRALAAFKADQRRLFRRQTVISIVVGFICLAATGITAIATHGARHSAPTIAVASAVPPSVPAVAPATPPAPVPPPVQNPPLVAAAAAPVAPAATPAPTAAPTAETEAPAVSIRPVALGRYSELPKEAVLIPAPKPAPPPRVLSPFENTVTQRLAASSQTVPASWRPIFEREAKGDSRAKLQIAAKFLKGEDVKPDPTFAVGLIRQAANGGNKEAMMWLAYSYEAGNFGKPEPVIAARWFSEAAKVGVTAAYGELGKLYEKGVDGAPDPETALAWYKRAAAAGDTKSAQAAARINRTLMADSVLLAAEPPAQKVPAPAPQAPAPRTAVSQLASVPAASLAPPPEPMQNPMAATPVAASAPPPPPPPAQIDEATAERQADIRAAQRMLKVLGYKIDKPDGALGPQTINAIRAYQKDHAAYPDGQFTPELLESLTQEIRFGR